MIQDYFRYYLMAFAGVTSDVLGACSLRNNPYTTSLVFLNRDINGAPQEIMIKVGNALDEWESGQEWVNNAINVFQFDPPQSRGDIEDRKEYVDVNKMPWPEIEQGGFPQWYIDVWNNNEILRPYMPDPN